VEFLVNQSTTFNQELHMAEIQAQFGATDAKYNQVLQVVCQYFTDGCLELSGFEHRIANGCSQMCDTVLVYTHRLTDTGGHETRDGTEFEGELSKKVRALESQVTALQEKVKTMEAQGQAQPEPTKEAGVPGSSETGDA
jgi:hypothetical protein